MFPSSPSPSLLHSLAHFTRISIKKWLLKLLSLVPWPLKLVPNVFFPTTIYYLKLKMNSLLTHIMEIFKVRIKLNDESEGN